MKRDELTLLESPAIIKHLEILQGIITRMAGNSASCKTWSVTLTTALLAVSIGNCKVPVWLSLVPAIVLFLLDGFYLGLERSFIALQKTFLAKLNDGSLKVDDIYTVKTKRSFLIHLSFVWSGMWSFATYFFYLPLIALIIILGIGVA